MNIQLFFLLAYTSGVTMLSYKVYAHRQGWPVGKLYYLGLKFQITRHGKLIYSTFIEIVGSFLIVVSFICSFFFVKWYFVLMGLILGKLISDFIIAIFRSHAQWIAILMLLFSFIFLIVSIFLL